MRTDDRGADRPDAPTPDTAGTADPIAVEHRRAQHSGEVFEGEPDQAGNQ